MIIDGLRTHRPDSGVILFTPGYRRTSADMERYADKIDAYAHAVGQRVIPMAWETDNGQPIDAVPDMADRIVNKYLTLVEHNRLLPVRLAGFSMGSVAMTLACHRLEEMGEDENVAALHLESMSPGFGEPFQDMVKGIADRGIRADDWTTLGVEERSKLTGEPLPLLHKPIYIYLGENEPGIMHQMAEYAHGTWHGYSTLHTVHAVDHDVDDPRYVQAARAFTNDMSRLGAPPCGYWFNPADLKWRGRRELQFAFTRRGSVAMRSERGYTSSGEPLTNPIVVFTLSAFYCFVNDVRTLPWEQMVSHWQGAPKT